tara:strand:- start:534 stop:1289 length:756 start_codon:yes stop_codon:yes gene_type:complete
MNWIKENTANCSVIATYWDPGHFITGIANRNVVFDGASQGANRLIDLGNGTVIERSRIQDIATVLFTSNEEHAIDILKNYNYEGCEDPMYFIASSDLLSKAQWWSYFSTWDPVNKGTIYTYATLPVSEATPIVSEETIAYKYVLDADRYFLIYDRAGEFETFFVQQNTFLHVESIYAFDPEGRPYISTNPEAEVKGRLWVSPDKQTVIFIPVELQESLFTKMFLYDGYGLDKFTPVMNFGGEVKLYKVDLS